MSRKRETYLTLVSANNVETSVYCSCCTFSAMIGANSAKAPSGPTTTSSIMHFFSGNNMIEKVVYGAKEALAWSFQNDERTLCSSLNAPQSEQKRPVQTARWKAVLPCKTLQETDSNRKMFGFLENA